MLVSHGHGDHVGNAAPDRQPDAGRSGRRSTSVQLWLGSVYPAPDDVIGMNKGGTVEVRGLRVTMTSADHSAAIGTAPRSAPLPAAERGFVVELEDGSKVYFAAPRTSSATCA